MRRETTAKTDEGGTSRLQRRRFDAVVLGGGVAGCTTALRLVRSGMSVALVSKDVLGESTSWLAQGGIAAALPGTGDRPGDHLADTLRAGGDFCDLSAATVLVESAPVAVAELVGLGTRLDRADDGSLARSREGGHGVARVVHAGGAATGAEVVRALVAAVRTSGIEILEGWFACELVVEAGRCVGVSGLDAGSGWEELETGNVVLATGGAGQLFALTTNPVGATGDGVALALRAGVPVADLEFIQFHPTALAVEVSPRPLLSEALRGEGGLLVDGAGRRFVDELAPRDVVSRAIAARMVAESSQHVYLDVRSIDRFSLRFPSLAEVLGRSGLDAAKDLLPVAPAAHYLCGGVLTDLDGATGLPGLWAVGEVACTGVHGANRLASNSLLEGLVFGARAAAAILDGRRGARPTGALGPLLGSTGDGALPVRLRRPVVSAPLAVAACTMAGASDEAWPSGRRRRPGDLEALREELGRAASAGAGVERDEATLGELSTALSSLRTRLEGLGSTDRRASIELLGLIGVGEALTALATDREESRGAHYRRDHPAGGDRRWRSRVAVGTMHPEASSSGDDPVRRKANGTR